MDRAAESARLNAIRGQLASLDAREWQLMADGEGMAFASAGADGSLVTIARFTNHATSDEMQFAADAATNVRFLLGLVDRAIRALRAHGVRACGPASAGAGDSARAPVGAAPAANGGRAAERAKDFAAEAAMKCAEPAFKVFLEERHGLERPLSDDRAAQRLRSLLGISTRAELNHDDKAAARWRQLRDEFKAWRAAG
jgi:hypothetical protein